MKRIVIGCLFLCSGALASAQQFVAPGTRGTLTVEYVYVAAGSKPDKYDPKSWNVTRRITTTTQLVAEKPTAISALRPMEKGQSERLEARQQSANKASQAMMPMAGDMMKIAEKCGEDEACIEREVTAYASGVNVKDFDGARKDIAAASAQDAPRYQNWKMVSESATWELEETYDSKNADPICASQPNRQCTRKETRIGGGALPPAPPKGQMLDFDSEKKDVYVAISPQPVTPMMYTETINTDHPSHKSGSQKKAFAGFGKQLRPLHGPLSAQGASSGKYEVKGAGVEGESGVLTVSWRFAIQK